MDQDSPSGHGNTGDSLIYFDNAATGRRCEYLADLIGENCGRARTTEECIRILAEAERRISILLGADMDDATISFVPNATYGINHVAYVCTEDRSMVRRSTIGLPICLSDSEHASNHLIWLRLTKGPIHYWSPETFRDMDLPDRPAIFAFASTTNLEGFGVAIEEINRKFAGTDHICIVDASQTFQHLIPDLRDTAIRHLIFTAHKFLGPNGIGVIFSRDPSPPGINSSNYARNKDNYSLDFDALEGWMAGIDVVEEMFRSGFAHRECRRLNRYFFDHFPRDNRFLRWINTDTKGLIFLMMVTDEHVSAHDYAFYLERNGVIVRSGIACSWLSGQRLDGQKIIRVSLGCFGGIQELQRFFRLVQQFSILDCL